MKLAAFILAVLAAPASASPSKPWVKPSFTGTVGSAGYWKYALSADAGWHEKDVDPYASGSFSEDPFVRKVSMIAGLGKDVDKATTLSAGAGFSLGHVKDVDANGGSFLLELGATRDVGPGTAGLDYSLDAGNVSVGLFSAASSRSFQAHGPARRGVSAPSLSAQTYNELSASYRWPFDAFTLLLRETLGLPSYAGAIYTTSVGAKVPLTGALSATATLAVDGGSTSGVYLSGGLAYLFE